VIFGLALATVLTIWLGVEVAEPNPFAIPAGKWPLEFVQRSFLDLGPWPEMGLATALLAAGLYVSRDLATQRARGEEIDYPVALTTGKGAPFIVRYYFGDEMIIARLTGEAKLDSEGDPIVFYLFDKTRGVSGIRGEDLWLFPPYGTQ
jgi:hypothetical protein